MKCTRKLKKINFLKRYKCSNYTHK